MERKMPKTCREASEMMYRLADSALDDIPEYTRRITIAEVLEAFGDTPVPERIAESYVWE